LLGWRPRWTLDEALKMVVNWHGAHERGDSLRNVVMQQIAHYETTPTLH